MEIELRGEVGNAGQLFKSCADLFWLLVQKIDFIKGLNQEQQVALRDEFGRFYFWGEGFHPENGKLDEILQLSGSLRDQTISLLMDVGRTLCSRETGLFGIIVSDVTDSKLDARRQELTSLIERLDMDANETEEFDTDSNASEDTDLEFSLGSVLQDLQFYVGCLTKLTISLEHPAPDPVKAETGPSQETISSVAGSAEVWCRKIAENFPDIEIRLAERLGEANWNRFERMMRMREASDGGLSEETEESESKEFGMLEPQAKSVISKITKSSFRSVLDATSSGKGSSSNTDPTLPTHSVHGFQPEDILDSAPQIKWTSLVLSVENFVKLHVLKVPPEALEKDSFCCTICKNELYNVKDELGWRNHVFADIQPYVCTVADCEQGLRTFKTRKAWAIHEFSAHRIKRNWTCGKCSKHFVEREKFRDHINSYHPSYFNLEENLIIDKAETKTYQSPKEIACPFCNAAPGSTIYRFASHVGRHLEDIALGLIPHELNGAPENDSKSSEEAIESKDSEIKESTSFSSTAIRLQKPLEEQFLENINSLALVYPQRLFKAQPGDRVSPRPDYSEIPVPGKSLDREGSDLSRAQNSGIAIPSGQLSGSVLRSPPVCFEIGCGNSFKRLYDLRCHQENVHRIGMLLHCPEPFCDRVDIPDGHNKGGFSRLDHFYEHAKKVHRKEVFMDATGHIWMINDREHYQARWTDDTLVKESTTFIEESYTFEESEIEPVVKEDGWKRSQSHLEYVDQSDQSEERTDEGIDWFEAYLKNERRQEIKTKNAALGAMEFRFIF